MPGGTPEELAGLGPGRAGSMLPAGSGAAGGGVPARVLRHAGRARPCAGPKSRSASLLRRCVALARSEGGPWCLCGGAGFRKGRVGAVARERARRGLASRRCPMLRPERRRETPRGRSVRTPGRITRPWARALAGPLPKSCGSRPGSACAPAARGRGGCGSANARRAGGLRGAVRGHGAPCPRAGGARPARGRALPRDHGCKGAEALARTPSRRPGPGVPGSTALSRSLSCACARG